MNQTIIAQARVITALAEENKKWMEQNARLEKLNFELIGNSARMAGTIRELRKEVARRGKHG